MKTLGTIIISATFLFPLLAHGATDCTVGDAVTGANYRTIAQALAAEGSGNYTITVKSPYSSNEVVNLTQSGISEGSPLTIRSEIPGGTTLQRFNISGDYLVVEGFVLTGYPSLGGEAAAMTIGTASSFGVVKNCQFIDQNDGVYSIMFDNDGAFDPTRESDHWRVENCLFSNQGGYARNSIPAPAMIHLTGEAHRITGNTFQYSCGADALRIFGKDHVIDRNYWTRIEEVSWHGNHADLFQTFGNNGECAYNILIEKNHAFDCGWTSYINGGCQIGQVVAETALGGNPSKFHHWTIRNNLFVMVSASLNIAAEYTQVLNNTFYSCTKNLDHVVRLPYNPSKGISNNSQVLNNVFVKCGAYPDRGFSGWYEIGTGVLNATADYNFVAGNGFLSKAEFSETHGINGGDPTFISESTYNLRPSAGSFLLNKGTILTGFTDDFDSNPRLGLYDIGAFERSEVRPSPPGNLTIQVAYH